MSCEFCRERKPLLTMQVPVMYFDDISFEDRHVIIDRGYLRWVDPDDMQCLDHGEKVEVNYCPMCGAGLEGEK